MLLIVDVRPPPEDPPPPWRGALDAVTEVLSAGGGAVVRLRLGDGWLRDLLTAPEVRATLPYPLAVTGAPVIHVFGVRIEPHPEEWGIEPEGDDD